MRPVLHGVRTALQLLGAGAFALYGVWDRIFCGPPPRLPLDPDAVRRVLVVRLDLLGDAVFSIPAIEALAAAFPGARIDVLALPYTASIFRRVPSVGRVHELDVNAYRRPSGVLQLRALLRAVRTLRAERYDLAVGFSRLLGGIFAAQSGARWRVGHPAETFRGCYNIPLPGQRYERGEHEVEYCLAVVEAVSGCSHTPDSVPMLPGVTARGEEARAAAASAVSSASQLPLSGGRYVVLVPGASNGSAKRWPAPLWSKLADRIVRELKLGVVLSGSPAERHLAEVVAAPLTPPPLNLAGQLSVEDLPALLAGAEVVVAGDTGPLHLAAALGTAVVGIYGPTDPRNTGPRGQRARTIRLGIGCSPCYDLRSPAECKLPDRSVACMWGLRVDRIFDSVAALAGLPDARRTS